MSDISSMTDEEIEKELERLAAFKVPSSPVPKAPKVKKERAAAKPSWRDALGLK